jgi:hypothetical protein
MRRGKFGRRIEFYTHALYGGNIPIYLDVGRALFSAVVGDVTLQDENLSALKKVVVEALKNQHSIEWIPVLEIGFGGDGWLSGSDRNEIRKNVNLNFERYWIAKKIDGNWIASRWDESYYPSGSRKPIVRTGDRVICSKPFRDAGERDPLTGDYKIPKNFSLPWTKKREDRDETPTYYLPYSKELWKSLVALSKKVDELQQHFVDILGTDEGRAKLIGSASKAPDMDFI